jgi:hypothetical protein
MAADLAILTTQSPETPEKPHVPVGASRERENPDLDQIDTLTTRIEQLSARVSELIEGIPAAQGVAVGTTGPRAGTGLDAPVLPAVARPAAAVLRMQQTRQRLGHAESRA